MDHCILLFVLMQRSLHFLGMLFMEELKYHNAEKEEKSGVFSYRKLAKNNAVNLSLRRMSDKISINISTYNTIPNYNCTSILSIYHFLVG
uniref:Uncharacterized protein n=1 Tax=Rhizophora mucronata TaxID=61149 RepID=A0A2P2LSQ8_RHIMU